jgi:integrase/recombinase XerD
MDCGAGDVAALRLSDVDWQRDVLRIQHSKNGGPSELPLLPAVGNAILDNLQKGRPKTDACEIVIHHRAPYRRYPNGSSLYRLAGCGKTTLRLGMLSSVRDLCD